MTISLHHLRYFLDAAAQGGMGQAARKNFLTQSAVSRAIASLEADLGAQLVLHGHNRFQLTEAGQAVVAKGFAIFDAVAQLREVAASHNQTLLGPLRLGCNHAIAGRLIGPMLAKIEAKYPGIKPEIKLGNTDQVQHMLERRDIDFGIVMDDGEVGGRYSLLPLMKDSFVVVRPPSLRHLEPGRSLIVSRTKKGGMSGRYFAAYESAYSKPIEPKLVVGSWQVILDLAVAGFGCALVPAFLCREELERGQLEVVRHKVRPLPYSLGAIVGKGRVLPQNAGALVACFREFS
jgi:LysR family transcriptional regulator, transcriptional activator of the cysJI operon